MPPKSTSHCRRSRFLLTPLLGRCNRVCGWPADRPSPREAQPSDRGPISLDGTLDVSPRPLILLSAREPSAQCNMRYPIQQRLARRLSQSTKGSEFLIAQGWARVTSASWLCQCLLSDRSLGVHRRFLSFVPSENTERGFQCLAEGNLSISCAARSSAPGLRVTPPVSSPVSPAWFARC
jgi:hypothetical protein